MVLEEKSIINGRENITRTSETIDEAVVEEIEERKEEQKKEELKRARKSYL